MPTNKDLILYLPFSYRFFLRSCFSSDIKTVLDVGCGDGEILKITLPDKHNFDITGIDIHEESLRVAGKKGIYKKLLKCDLTTTDTANLLGKKFDMVFCSQLIEHLEKKSGEKLLDKFDKLANKKIFITTPNGFLPVRNLTEFELKNPHQDHLSGWMPKDFKNRGYKVYGQGWKMAYHPESVVARFPESIKKIFYLISYLLAPFLYFYPKYSYNLIAIKKI